MSDTNLTSHKKSLPPNLVMLQGEYQKAKQSRALEKEALEILKRLIPIRRETDELKIIAAKVLVCTQMTIFINKNFLDEANINQV